MTFKYDWFSQNIVKWTTVLKRFKGKSNLNFLEIGCFEGMATKWLFENILTNNSSKITVIDTFEGSMENKMNGDETDNLLLRFKNNLSSYISSNNNKNRVIIKKGFSYSILRMEKPNEKYDFIYIDGSHFSKDVLEDAILSWRLLKKNGIMVFDDYEWKLYDNPLLCPKIAINAFLKIFEDQYTLINKGYQITIKKKGDNITRKKISVNNFVYDINDNSQIKQMVELKEKNKILKLGLEKTKVDLQLIRSSKTYKLWQLFCKYRKNLLNY